MTASVLSVPVELLHKASAALSEGHFDDPRQPLPQLSKLAPPEQLVAVSHRLRAFINFIHTGVEIPFWITRAPDDGAAVHQALFDAVAIAPLAERAPEQLTFNPDELIRAAFHIVEPVGNA